MRDCSLEGPKNRVGTPQLPGWALFVSPAMVASQSAGANAVGRSRRSRCCTMCTCCAPPSIARFSACGADTRTTPLRGPVLPKAELVAQTQAQRHSQMCMPAL